MRKTKYTVKYTTGFKKDYKRAIKRGLKIELLEQVVAMLAMNGLPPYWGNMYGGFSMSVRLRAPALWAWGNGLSCIYYNKLKTGKCNIFIKILGK